MKNLFAATILSLIVFSAFFFLQTFILFSIWNTYIVTIFSLPILTYWQTVALYFFVRLLFSDYKIYKEEGEND